MIIKDLNKYLDYLDQYVKQSIKLIEAASELYGEIIDDTLSKSEFIGRLKPISDNSKKIVFEVGDFSIEDLAPDSFQYLDSAFSCFIHMCDNYMIYLSRLAENGSGNHWLINKTIEDIQHDYKKLFECRKSPEVSAISECRLPKALILNSKSRGLEAMRQTLNEEGFVCTKLELSSDEDLAQLNIELVAKDIEREDLLDLAFKCFQIIDDDLASLSHVKAVYIGFRIGNQNPYSWLRIDAEKIHQIIINDISIEEFERIIEFHYFEDIIAAEQVLLDLATHSSVSTEDFEFKEALMILVQKLEIIKKACMNPDPLANLILRWSFSRSLLSCISILLAVVSATRDPDAAHTIKIISDMYRQPDEVDPTKDYSKLFSEISDLIEALKFRYVVLPNVRKYSLSSHVKPFSQIALVQPKISLNSYYNDKFQLTPEGAEKHIDIFNKSICQAIQNDVDAIVFPEMFIPTSQIEYIKKKSRENNLIIITGLDYELASTQGLTNSCAIALPDGRVIRQKKLFKSKYDLPQMVKGNELSVFETPIGEFSVFICYDYLSSQDLVKLRGVIDTLFVLTLNPDARSYHEKALADAYSTLYGFICIVNAFDPDHSPPILGGSGSYGPLKKDKTIAQFEDGVVGIKIVKLPLHELYEARSGNKSSIMKGLPANFKSVSLAKDYPEEEVSSIRELILQKIKEEKRRDSRKGKTNYDVLKEECISHNLETDLDSQKYAIMDLEPAHTGVAKRLKAFLLIEKGLSKEDIKSIIQVANDDVKKIECYSDEIQESNHKGKSTDVVWLYIFNERRHRRHLAASDFYDYFVCRTQWIRPGLNPRFSPSSISGDEIFNDIEIEWNKNYDN